MKRLPISFTVLLAATCTTILWRELDMREFASHVCRAPNKATQALAWAA